jgi:hypothetical protein
MAMPNSPIDVTTLTRFRKQLAEIFGRSQGLRFTYEMACGLVARYPVLIEAQVGSPTGAGAQTTLSQANQNFFALTPHAMTQDFPEAQDQFDWYVPSMNLMWWNKVMSGAYVSTPDSGSYPPPNYSFDGSPRLLQYVIHTVRDYAVTAEYVFTYFMQSREVWNNAFTQQNYVGILAEIRDLFTDAQRSSNTGEIVSNSGFALAVLHSRVNGARPAEDMYGHSLWEYINVPRVGFQGVWDDTGSVLEGPTPSVLPDIWVQMESREHILAMSPMLSTNKLLTGLHLDDGQVTPLGGGSYTVPLTIETQPREVGLNTIPLLDDRMLFNARLVWHTFTAGLFTLDGNAYTVSVPAVGNVVAQKSIRPDWTVPNLLNPSVLTAKTTWFPFMTPDGLRLAVGVTQANGAALMTQIMGQKTTTGVATWLVRNAHAMPNAIVDGGGRNTTSRIPKRRNMGNSLPNSGPASEVGGVDQSS